MDHFSIAADDRESLAIAAQAFLDNHMSVIKLDIRTGEAFVLKSDLDQESVGKALPFDTLIARYISRRAYPPDRTLLSSLTLERLKQICIDQQQPFTLDLRCTTADGNFEWVKVTATRARGYDHIILAATRSINEAKLMRTIVDLFVYQNYDYLFLIDAKNDTYTRFTPVRGSVPVPPESGASYTEEMIRFNRRFVLPEDYERVTANMQLAHIVQMLAHQEKYCFTSSGIDKNGNYRRSQITFLYYDRTARLILCARTDVTQLYLEEKEKNRQLLEALKRAQRDAMTGLYNKKAISELITRSLDSQYRAECAFLLIDVDNFKMVNDTLGHLKGDELLCHLANLLNELAGHNGMAGRIGGDEYLLYLPSVTDMMQVEAAAREICHAFDNIEAHTLPAGLTSCSVGISIYPRDGTDYITLLNKADQALYTSKRYGKQRYYYYSLDADSANSLDALDRLDALLR